MKYESDCLDLMLVVDNLILVNQDIRHTFSIVEWDFIHEACTIYREDLDGFDSLIQLLNSIIAKGKSTIKLTAGNNCMGVDYELEIQYNDKEKKWLIGGKNSDTVYAMQYFCDHLKMLMLKFDDSEG